MKLLQKSDIVKAKALDRKMEIDEGVKLSRRVDTLREVHANEEASLDRFRRETLKAIHDEVTTESAKLDTLRSEVATIQEQRTLALKPILIERDELEKDKTTHASNCATLEQDRIRLNSELFSANKWQNELKKEEERLAALHLQVLSAMNEVDANVKATMTTRDEAESLRLRTVELKTKLEDEIVTRETLMAQKESELVAREDKLKKAQQKIEIDKEWIADRRAMLARDSERLNLPTKK